MSGVHEEFTKSSEVSKIILELQKRWCAILGLNQSRLANRRGRCRLSCTLETFVVGRTPGALAWLRRRWAPPQAGGTGCGLVAE
jgi:hypothetical protein